jgi:hypothetical protein
MSSSEICRTINKLANKLNEVAARGEEFADQLYLNAHSGAIKTAEDFCVKFDLKLPDGQPLKGEEAKAVSDIAMNDLRDGHFRSIDKLKADGFLHK